MRRACVVLAACALLLGCARAVDAATEVAPGICQTVDIRNFPREMAKLRGCRVIEGQLSIVLMERASYRDFANISFPELREVTGYVKIYRMKGVRNLGDLFPNLSVVRGMQLFKDYAIVIFDSENIEMLGLRSLTTVERGAVRIQNNDRLCYANTIDWSKIIREEGAASNMIRGNYDTRLCGLCPNAQSRMEDHRQPRQCPADANGRLLCWDDKHCQKVCPLSCPAACMDNGTCCHKECLGGCDGLGAKDCHVCRHFSLGYGPNRTCTRHCPAGFYELFRRCVTEHECRQMPPPVTIGTPEANPPRLLAYKILKNTSCVWTCPSGYMEVGEKWSSTCQPCPESGCVRECPGGKIDSIASVELFRGCTHVKGTIEITLRASGGNTMAALEAALGEIRVINGGLKVTRSNPLVSLMFLKNLERITANEHENKGQSLHIFNNPNLELLWDWKNHKPIQVDGRLYIHFNPKLCYAQIEPLKKIIGRNFTDTEVSEENNGDQASCDPVTLNVKVHEVRNTVVILTWDMYCMEDSRKLLGYSIYYIIAEQNVTLYGQRDACSDSWNVMDYTMDEVRRNSTQEPEITDKLEFFANPCHRVQPLFYPVTQLIPFTRYAAYVKTFTTLQDKKGAQSPIIYFKTLPGRPSPPQALTVEPLDAHSVFIKWQPPAKPNGTIITYHVELQANSYNRETIVAGNNNYCSDPNALSNLIAGRPDDAPEREDSSLMLDQKNSSTCSCRDLEQDTAKGSRFSAQAEEERWESIQFENELQNQVYIKADRNRTKNPVRPRPRRSVADPESKLVILSGHHTPMFGENYTNITEGGFVKAQFYELDGSTHEVTVNNMRHFTWYTVNVWACRERQRNESDHAYEKTWCSVRAYYTFRTSKLQKADVVSNVHAYVVPSNKTFPEVNVTWTPPRDPNGFVVAYNVHYSRVDDSSQVQDVGVQSCIIASECRAGSCRTVLRNLLPGNYSLRVTPITVSGAGNGSVPAYVFIEERSAGHDWIWGVVGGCLIMTLMLGGGVWYARRGFLPPTEANKLFASVNPEYVSTVYVPDEWEVPRANIEFIRELGQGSFGMVYEGIAKEIEKGKPETRCAVKTVNEHATDRERVEFLNEASVMKAFDTHHVVRLLGVVSRGQPTLVVMELMEQGDLKTYLRSHRPDADSSLPRKEGLNPPTLQNILQMAIEIADGMAYLSAKKFVHRDLAARNCMVAGDLTVKVGDFGMTRDIYETDYYRKGTKGLLPVRWMSPESLKDGVFSSSTDIWSYGVVLWEMATLAMQPYQGLSNEQVVRYVVEGGVMERPEHCPDRLYELMRACWAHRPSQRPSFLQLVADLAVTAQPYFRHRSFFHTPQGQELYALQRTNTADEEQEMTEVNVGAVATGSGSNLFGVSGRLASWVRELSSLRSRGSDDAAAEPLQPAGPPRPLSLKTGPNGVLRDDTDPPTENTGC